MANRVQAINWFDASGGLNTRISSFQLAPNEIPEILNMEIDPRGGLYTRKGWERWSTDQVVTPGVDPYLLFDGGGDQVIVADSPSFDLVGDCQIVVGVRISDWTPAATRCLAAHTPSVGGFGEPITNGWALYLLTSGKLLFFNRSATGLRSFTSSAAVPATINANWWVGISFDQTDGSGNSKVRFWQSSVGPNGAWTEVGTVQSVADTGASLAGNNFLSIGAVPNATSMLVGRLLHCELRNAIGASNTMSTVSVIFELDTSTDLAASQSTDLTFTTASGATAQLTNGTMLVNSAAWNPRNAYLHENSSGTQYVIVANGTLLWSASAGGLFTSITNSDLAASPHLASFAPWGDNLYVSQGRTKQGMRTTGTGTGTLLTASASGAWQNDPTVHAGTHMPKSEVAASHQGRLFVANLNYDATNYPNRLHWSHAGFPESWVQTDFVEINEGGSKITGLAAFGDHLIIFKTDSIWALFGSDSETWQPIKITGDIGVPNPQAVAVGTQSLYFFAGEGIYRYANGSLDEVSYPIRNIFPDIPVTSYSNIWLGWVDRRLWASLPYDPKADTPPTEPVALFVFDPIIGPDGAWTRFQGAEGHPIGPYVDHTSSADAPKLAFCRFVPHAIKLNARDDSFDNLHGVDLGFAAHFRTGWFDANMPSLRKSWRRPDFQFRHLNGKVEVSVESFNDYNTASVKRSTTVSAGAPLTSGFWGDGRLWGDGTLWDSSPDGLESDDARGSGLGMARSIALRLSAAAGARWGVNVIVNKFIPRKLR